MLSTLHFYNNYNSFILDKEKIRERKASPYLQYKKQSNQYKDTEFKYFLNKSLNDNIKAYMFELSANFNGLKNIVNNIYEKIYHNLPMETLDDKLESFTTMYNRFIGFLEENTENSGEFKDILDNTKNTINENIDILNQLGINISKNGFLNLKNDQQINLHNIDTHKSQKFYLNLYNKICSFMEQPMSNYMDFKDFSYYFNYSGDYDKNKSFKIVEQGILIDIIL